jgi:hypothetical protein
MFNVNSQETDQDPSAPPQSLDVESVLIIRELSTMINKYGIERISKALDQILSKPEQKHTEHTKKLEETALDFVHF